MTTSPVQVSVSHATRLKRILLQAGVENRVGDLIGNLVRMTFGHGLRGEEKTVGCIRQSERLLNEIAGPSSAREGARTSHPILAMPKNPTTGLLRRTRSTYKAGRLGGLRSLHSRWESDLRNLFILLP